MFTICRFAQSKPSQQCGEFGLFTPAKLLRSIGRTSWQYLASEFIFAVVWKVFKKLESNNSLITKLQPLGMLRHLVKWHPGVAEQFIWKHVRVVQEKMLVERSSGNYRVWDWTYCWQFVRTTWLCVAQRCLVLFSMCWTYAHWLSPEACKYYLLVAHTGESQKVQ